MWQHVADDHHTTLRVSPLTAQFRQVSRDAAILTIETTRVAGDSSYPIDDIAGIAIQPVR